MATNITMTDFGVVNSATGSNLTSSNYTATSQDLTNTATFPVDGETEFPVQLLDGSGYIDLSFTYSTPVTNSETLTFFNVDMYDSSFNKRDKSLVLKSFQNTIELAWFDNAIQLTGIDPKQAFSIRIYGQINSLYTGLYYEVVQSGTTFSDKFSNPIDTTETNLLKLSCSIKTPSDSLSVTNFLMSDGLAQPLSATFLPADIGVEVGDTTVQLSATIDGGTPPYTTEWFYDGQSPALSNANPYNFPVDINQIGHYVLGVVTDANNDTVQQQLDIVEGGFRWLAEPSDYSGNVDSTMPVSGEVSGEVSGGINFDSPAIDIFTGGLSYTKNSATSFSCNSTTTGFACGESSTFVSYSDGDIVASWEVKNITLDDGISNYVGYRVVDSAGLGLFGTVSYRARDSLQIQWYSGGSWNTSSISQVNIYDDYTIKFTYTKSTQIVDVVVVQNGVEHTTTYSTTLMSQITEIGHFPFVASRGGTQFGFTLEDYSVATNSETTFTLTDKNSNVINNQVSINGKYDYTVPNMQPSQTGTWNLKATQGTETIISPFEVDIASLSWVTEPASPNEVEEGSQLVISAEVEAPDYVDWHLTKNGITVEVIYSNNTYSFSKTAELSDSGADWLLSAHSGPDTIYSSFEVIVGEKINILGDGAVTPINCTIDLAIGIIDGWNNTFVAIDYGYEFDTYESVVGYLKKGNSGFEIRDSNAPVNLVGGSYYPFGPHFSTEPTGFYYPTYVGRDNTHGDYGRWTVTLVPSTGDYSYELPVWSSLFTTGFGFGIADNFPVPSFLPTDVFNISYNRNSNEIREYDRGADTVRRKTTLTWVDMCEDNFAFLMSYIITTIRGNVFTLDFGDTIKRLSPWKQYDSEEGETIFNVKLSSHKISYSCRDGGLWSVAIEVMKWEE